MKVERIVRNVMKKAGLVHPEEFKEFKELFDYKISDSELTEKLIKILLKEVENT